MTRLLTRAEAAEYLRVPAKTLATWAYHRDGPPFYKLGKHTRYDLRELQEWCAARRVEAR
jgi:excisionase family DNA binding protein